MRNPTLPLVLIASTFAVGASPAAASTPAHGANTKQDRAALRRERVAVGLINKASLRVRRTHPRCRVSFDFDRGPTFTDARPSDALLNAIGVLRRPATESDRIERDRLSFMFATGVYESWTRVATAADGRQFVVIVSQDRARPRPRPDRCTALESEQLDRLLVDRTAAVRRVALRIKAQADRSEHPRGGFESAEAIFLFDRTADGGIGGGGGGVDLAYFRRHGLFGSSGAGDRSTVSGLLPDGVASVELTYARAADRGPHRDPQVYAKAIELTVPVQDNVVSFEVARPAYDALPVRMVWRRADGSVVRRIDRTRR